jgi:hypothetical protein
VKNNNYFVGIRLKIATDEQQVYWFEGSVDEHFTAKQVPLPHHSPVIFDLAGIKNMSSYGVRHWIAMIERLTLTHDVVFRNCSISLMDQINITPAIADGCLIASFYAPYYCETCGECSMLINTREHWHLLTQQIAPTFHCEKCQGLLSFDALEEGFLMFAHMLEEENLDILPCHQKTG